jgi:protein involved in polysaccharide export with SLBB domain
MDIKAAPILLIFLVIYIFAGCAAQTAVTPNNTAIVASSGEHAPYFIQPGDQLDIKFFYNSEINESLYDRTGRYHFNLLTRFRQQV